MSELRYFLQIDGINGGSTVKNYEGWFEISAHDLDVLNLLGGKGSVADFSSLTVDLELGSSLALLYAAIAEGQIINSLQIEGAVLNGDTSKYQSVYELRLANVRLTALDEGSDDSDRLSFDFTKIGISTTPQTTDGSFGTAQTYGYDHVLGGAVSFGSIPEPSTPPSSQGSAPEPQRY